MAEQYTPNLGHTPTDDARRDAIHVAVAPVEADMLLLPGQRVGMHANGKFGTAATEKIGIVDPFRGELVCPGERFWLLLFPGTITGLRHAWQHPAFQTRLPTTKEISCNKKHAN